MPAAAPIAQLRHVHDGQPGMHRRAAGKGWRYFRGTRPVKDKATLARIRALAIPPAWTDVWICARPDGHLQATGRDARGRKQYRYHAKWAEVRGRLNFHRLLGFGKRLRRMRERVRKDLRREGMPLEKVLAGAIALMEQFPMRVGSKAYERANGSFGLSTLKNKHMERQGRGEQLRFRGKGGKVHEVAVTGQRLARLMQRCKELPGQDLFTYADAEGVAHDVGSAQVNDYIRSATGGAYSSKDLRTWTGTARCLAALLEMEAPGSEAELMQRVNKAVDEAATHLGNTRAVCKRHYVHPGVIAAFQEGRLAGLAQGVRGGRSSGTGLDKAERVLMKVLASGRGG